MLFDNELSLRQALLLVGSKRSEFSSDELSELRSAIHDSPELGFLSKAIAELESLWPIITASHPGLEDIHGDQSLHQLAQFFEGGNEPKLKIKGTRQDNVLLEVLTVLTHVTSFVSVAQTRINNALVEPSKLPNLDHQSYDIQGFCLGFLTASAVAVSKNEDDFAKNVRVILRIAVCIGALVDADAARMEKSGARALSMSVRWSSEAGYSELNKALDTYQDVSCEQNCASRGDVHLGILLTCGSGVYRMQDRRHPCYYNCHRPGCKSNHATPGDTWYDSATNPALRTVPLQDHP